MIIRGILDRSLSNQIFGGGSSYEKDAHITLKEEITKHIKAVLVDVFKFKIQN